MAKFYEEYKLWEEFLVDCKKLMNMEDTHEWVNIELHNQPTKEEVDKIIEGIYIRNAPLNEIVLKTWGEKRNIN